MTHPRFDAVPAPPGAILAMRADYLREIGAQVVHESWHARGLLDPWLLRSGSEVVGHGCLGGEPEGARETVRELYVAPAHRAEAAALLGALVAASGARRITAQTNDPVLGPLLGACGRNPVGLAILFDDGGDTALPSGGATLRRLGAAERDRVFAHAGEPVGEWGLELEGSIVATGGILTHYNPPWADLHMEVAAGYRRRGLGSYLVQELKRLCRARGLAPAARCRVSNEASRRTLARAGMRECGRLVSGEIGP